MAEKTVSRVGSHVARRVLLPVGVLLAVMIGLGLLVTRVLYRAWPLTTEDAISRRFAAARTPSLNSVSEIGSILGSTSFVIGLTALAAAGFWLWLRRWQEPLFLAAGVTAQAVVFFLTTLVIERSRPTVNHLDVSPPTSSFPSGHTSAAVALYCGLAFLLASQARTVWLKRLAWLLVLVPVAVAVSRVYRGMHHPSDVVASFLNGLTCLWIMSRAVLQKGLHKGQRQALLSRNS